MAQPTIISLANLVRCERAREPSRSIYRERTIAADSACCYRRSTTSKGRLASYLKIQVHHHPPLPTVDQSAASSKANIQPSRSRSNARSQNVNGAARWNGARHRWQHIQAARAVPVALSAPLTPLPASHVRGKGDATTPPFPPLAQRRRGSRARGSTTLPGDGPAED
jgi:hypothetical protein